MTCKAYDCQKQATQGFDCCSGVCGYEFREIPKQIKRIQENAFTYYTDKTDERDNVICMEDGWTSIFNQLGQYSSDAINYYAQYVA